MNKKREKIKVISKITINIYIYIYIYIYIGMGGEKKNK